MQDPRRHLYDYIGRELKLWKPVAERVVKSNLEQITFTGSLANSLQISVQGNERALIWEAVVSFEDYGTVIESTKTFAYRAPVDRLTDWVMKRGVGSFQEIPGYARNMSKRLPPDIKAARRIAWAIKMSEESKRGQNPGKKSPVAQYGGAGQWFYYPFFREFRKVREKVIDEFLKVAGEIGSDVVREAFGSPDLLAGEVGEMMRARVR